MTCGSASRHGSHCSRFGLSSASSTVDELLCYRQIVCRPSSRGRHASRAVTLGCLVASQRALLPQSTPAALALAIADGLLSVDDRVVDVLPDHVPDDISEQGRRLAVHHLLSMPMGVDHAEWDRVAGGAAFGFNGPHLTTEAVAAFGEVL